jgi:hypothetical protein
VHGGRGGGKGTLSIRTKGVKILRRKWEYLNDFAFGCDFLDMTPKAQYTKEKKSR